MVWDEHPSGGRTGPLGKYILKFSVFAHALPGCPPFLVLVLNFDGSLGFSPVLTHYCSVWYTACESSAGRSLYSSLAYPLATLTPGVRFVF